MDLNKSPLRQGCQASGLAPSPDQRLWNQRGHPKGGEMEEMGQEQRHQEKWVPHREERSEGRGQRPGRQPGAR